MPSITLTEVHLAFGERELLDGVSFGLAAGARIALTGANGSGKSTLLRIIAGHLPPDSGQVNVERGTRLAYLPQLGAGLAGQDRSLSLYRAVETAFCEPLEVEEELAGVAERLSRLSEGSPELPALLERHHRLQSRLEASGLYEREQMITRVLDGLGFQPEDRDRSLAQFSEGWQMRAALARVLCERADLLLLDEPTNYLDLEARSWLEGFLASGSAGVVVVSHDRYFLDVTVGAVAELYGGKLTVFPGNFSSYERRRSQELAQIAEAYERQQEEIERIESFIRRFRYNASKARQVQSRVRQLEKMPRLEPPPARPGMRFTFPQPPRSGRVVLELEKVCRRYGEREALHQVSLKLERGEKLVLVGPNGAGKSTLMRLAAGREQPSEGRAGLGHGVEPAYFSAEAPDSLSGAGTVLELVEGWAPTDLVPRVRGMLAAFLFRGEEVYKPVSGLSGGERSRLALLRLLLKPANLLLLDEPTNHLDMASKDVLLDALQRYPGSIVFVSHDRYFIEALATRVLELREGRAWLYHGDYRYYLWRLEQGPAGSGGSDSGPSSEAGRPGGDRWESGEGPVSRSQLERLEDKERKRQLRRLERQEADLMGELEALQAVRGELERSLARQEVYLDGQKVREVKGRLDDNARRQETLTRRWEELEGERAELLAGTAEDG